MKVSGWDPVVISILFKVVFTDFCKYEDITNTRKVACCVKI